jgi:hypothetical protein
MSSLFNYSFDSFGTTSLIKKLKWRYWNRLGLGGEKWYEGHHSVTLLELLRGKIISQREISMLSDLDGGSEARRFILEELEKKLHIF